MKVHLKRIVHSIFPAAAAACLLAGCGAPATAGDTTEDAPLGTSSEKLTLNWAINWQPVFNLGTNLKAFAACADGKRIYALDNQGNLSVNFSAGVGQYSYWYGYAGNTDWQSIACSDKLLILNSSRQLFRLENTDLWSTQVYTYIGNPYQTRQIAATTLLEGVQSIFALNDDDSIWWSTTGADNQWNYRTTRADIDQLADINGVEWAMTFSKQLIVDTTETGNWQLVTQIPYTKFLSSDGQHLYAYNNDGTVYLGTYYATNPPQPPPPPQVPPPSMPPPKPATMPTPPPASGCPNGAQPHEVTFCVMCEGDTYGHEVSGPACDDNVAYQQVQNAWLGCDVYRGACQN